MVSSYEFYGFGYFFFSPNGNNIKSGKPVADELYNKIKQISNEKLCTVKVWRAHCSKDPFLMLLINFLE